MDPEIYIPQQNIADIGLVYTETAGGSVERTEHFISMSAPGFFYTRNIIDHPPVSDVQQLVDTIKERSQEGKPSLTTFTAEVMPPDTAETFLQNGFQHYFIQTGMVLDPGAEVDDTPDPHVIRLGEDEVCLWTDTMMAGFVEEGKKREDEIFETLVKRPDMYFLVYEEEGRFTGSLLFHLQDAYSGIHEVAVSPEQRGKGIAKKLVRHALQIMKANGNNGAALQASPMGRPVYEKFGFRKVSQVHTLFLPE